MENKKVNLSFDFDGCLSLSSTQKYAKELVDKGYEVHIVTSRYDDIKKYSVEAMNAFGIKDLEREFNELFVVANRIGIKRENIHFTNMEYKCNFFLKNPGFIWHLDDNKEELALISMNKSTIPVDIHNNNYVNICNKLLNIE